MIRRRPWKRMMEALQRLQTDQSLSSISRDLRISATSLAQMAVYAREAGWPIPARPRPTIDEKRVRHTAHLFETTTWSNREICRQFGYALTTVNQDRHRFHAELIRRGVPLKKCECGLPLHHPRWCWVRRSKIQCGTSHEVRERIAVYLSNGGTINAASAKFGVSRWVVTTVRRKLAPSLRSQRDAALAAQHVKRRGASIARATPNRHALRPESVDILATISDAVPGGIDRSLRDDIIGQLYLDYIEGKFVLDKVKAAAKRAISGAYGQFASQWGPVSLDAVDEPGERPMIECVTHSIWD